MSPVPFHFNQPKTDRASPLLVDHQPEFTTKVMDDELILRQQFAQDAK